MALKKKGEDPQTALKKLTEDDTPSQAAGLLAWGSVAVGAVLFAYIAFAFAPSDRLNIEFGRDVETTASIRPAKPAGSVTTVGLSSPGNASLVTGSIANGPPPVAQRDLDIIRQDVQALRRSVATTNAINDELTRRLAALETLATRLAEEPRPQPAPVAEAPRPAEPEPPAAPVVPPRVIPLPTAQPVSEPIPVPARPEAVRPAAEAVRPMMPPLPGATFAPIVSPIFAGQTDAATAEPETTGSIPSQPVAIPRPAPPRTAAPEAAAPTAPPAASPAGVAGADAGKSDFGIDLGGFKSMTQARQAWQAFHARNAEVLGAIGPIVRVEENTDGSMDLRLIAGPYGNALEAIRHCARMKLQGATCVPTLYVGQGLAMQ